VTGPARLLWEARSLAASSGRRHAEDAMNRSGPREDPAVGRTPRGHGPEDQHARRVLEEVMLVRPGTTPAGGWGR
jgi:hypothetical protein